MYTYSQDMRVADQLYFAPEITFSELNLSDGDELLDQLQERIEGYYLRPARELVEGEHAFAAGVIIVTCIDALSRFEYGTESETDERFPKWCGAKLPAFADGFSRRFYCDFRNGLVHESRVKEGGEFTFGIDKAVVATEDIFAVNPKYLVDEVSTAFDEYIKSLSTDKGGIENLKQIISSDFEYELNE